MRITTRIAVVVAVPLVVMGLFAGWALTKTAGEQLAANRLRSLVAVADQAGDLAHQLQNERAAAAVMLAGGSAVESTDTYAKRVAATDEAADRYRRLRARLSTLPAGAAALVEQIDGQLERLTGLREQVRSAPTAALSSVIFTYRIVIANLISYRESVPQAGGAPADLADQIRAAAALSRATEFAAQQQVAVLRAAAARTRLTPAGQQEIMAARAGYSEAVSGFANLASPQWQAWLDRALTGPDVLTAQRLEDLVARTPAGAALELDLGQWVAATMARADLLHGVEQRIDEALRGAVGRLHDRIRALVVVQAAVVVVALLAAVLVAVRLGRSMIRRLKLLTGAARDMAFTSLPGAVQKLRRAGAREVNPDEFADRFATPLHTDNGGDEIADVGRAISVVHREAIRMAAQVSNTRAGLGQIFVNLARRAQHLVGALTRELDGVERTEDDPDRLAHLFRLDHLVTRMGRYTANLLVVGGHGSGRLRGTDIPLAEVLRAAGSRIERYKQVYIGDIEQGVVVADQAVDDVMNLFVELIDNAAAYSHPDVPIQVGVQALRDRVIVQVIDRGIGLPPAQCNAFNQMLAVPPPIDIAVIRTMGLTVVAHIASWYGIKVVLRRGAGAGTIAEVLLPATVVRVERGESRPPTAPEPFVPRLLDRQPDTAPAAASASRAIQPPARAALPATPHQGPGGGGGAGAAAGHRTTGEATVELPLPPPPPQPPQPLPIFREVERRWGGFFARSMAASVGSRDNDRAEAGPDPDPSWRSPADDGWAAAARVATPRVAQAMPTGLPRRDPMANLVPGAVPAADGSGAVDYRDPDRVAASMAAFALGTASRRPHGQPVPVAAGTSPQEHQ